MVLFILQQFALSSGAGMVNFATIQQATEAIAALDGQVLPNSTKPLIAKYAATYVMGWVWASHYGTVYSSTLQI